GINVMVINMQAFNATGQDARRIYEELDEFNSRRPIDVIQKNHPILILDEPQKMEGDKTLESLKKFNPLFILRYSATHKTTHNKIHRLDALDAYNHKLVKKIAARGIRLHNLPGSSAYLYLESIETSSTHPPKARVEIEVKTKAGRIQRTFKKLERGHNLFDLSGGLGQYRGCVVSEIDARTDTLSFTNGLQLQAGDASGDVNEGNLRRIQIRETIQAHLRKEQVLFRQGIKVLSLFFIDTVAKYRDYTQADEKGEYARLFEEEYALAKEALLAELPFDEVVPYREYLASIEAVSTHQGYFSIDKKNKRLVDPNIEKTGQNKGQSSDVDAYDLILKNKQRLLSFEEPTRFIFSHSALREGWDNPNVFVICLLKHSDNTLSRRQEVGRGLRLCVNQHGERMDDPATVHRINELTVVTNESYTDFVAGLQKELSEAITARPTQATPEFFQGKTITLADGRKQVISERQALSLYKWLAKHDFIDENDSPTPACQEALHSNSLPPLPQELQPLTKGLTQLLKVVAFPEQKLQVDNDRDKKPLAPNANLHKRAFLELWKRIHHKAVYKVYFDSEELIERSIDTLNRTLNVVPLQYVIESGQQHDTLTDVQLRLGDGFSQTSTTHTAPTSTATFSAVRYDLIATLGSATGLTRKTVVAILTGMRPEVFRQFQHNPESFIQETSRLINEQKATTLVDKISYNRLEEAYQLEEIFTTDATFRSSDATELPLQKHVYDFVQTDSATERAFVKQLDASTQVSVYAKLPRGFKIPTPIGDYNPDWAIVFEEASVKHLYFVAETKGSLSSLDLREIEKGKIHCAEQFFEALNRSVDTHAVAYHKVNSYDTLMTLVQG
ncbi:MAG: restriction endonuclease subunit R, partial [Vampirovibrionales bacterium]